MGKLRILPTVSVFVRHICLLLAVVTTLAPVLGCRKKVPDRQSSRPSDLPAEMVENIVQTHWMRESVKVKSITYQAAPFPSKGGRVPPGVKIIPARVRVSINGEPEKDVQLYFYQNPFGAWETYGEEANR